MFSVRPFFIAVICLSFIIISTCSAKQKSPATPSDSLYSQWVPVDEADWAVYMEAPEYHFTLAREYLLKGDIAKASSELLMGKSFLTFQRNRLSYALRQIDNLSNAISSGKVKDTVQFDSVTSTAMKVINHKYAMIPVEVDAITMFEEGHQYHYGKAKLKMQENERSKTAAEIRRAASYLKLQAITMGHTAGADLDSTGNALKKLASRIESGASVNVKELESIFDRKAATVSKKQK